METRTVKMCLSACCGNGAEVQRSLTKEQYDYLKSLAEQLSENDGHSTPFTVPFFYVADWEECEVWTR